MREAKLRITGDSKSGVASLKAVEAQGASTAKSIRRYAGEFRTLGAFLALNFLKDQLKTEVDFNAALRRTADALGISRDEYGSFAKAVQDLRLELEAAGIDTSTFADALQTSAIELGGIKGKGNTAFRAIQVLRAAMSLSQHTGDDYGSTLKMLVGLMRAYEIPAEEAASKTAGLWAAAKAAHIPVDTLAKDLENLGPAAKAAKVPFDDVLLVLASMGAGGAPAVGMLLDLKQRAQDGDAAALAFLQRIGSISNAGEDIEVIPFTTLANDLSNALADGIVNAGNLRSALDSTVSDDALQKIRGYRDALADIARLKHEIAAAEAAGPAAPQSAGSKYLQNVGDADARIKSITGDNPMNKSATGALAPYVVGAWETMYNSIKSWIAAPRLMADGGITTGPTHAIIGEAGPEAVIPLDRLGEMGGRSTQIGTVNVVANNPAQFARALSRKAEFDAYYRKLGSKKGG